MQMPKSPIQYLAEEVQSLKCSKFFDPNYDVSDYSHARYTYDGDGNLPIECDLIRTRSYFQEADLYPDEKEFPIAYARNVFMVSS
jgi:hypothetical protein